MNTIEYSVPLEIVQLSYSTPNKNIINPINIILGRNENFTEINRMYIKCDISLIPSNSIIESASLNIPVLKTIDTDGNNNANMIGFLVTAPINNIDNISWNNMPEFDLTKSFFNQDIHPNNIVSIDLTNYIKDFINNPSTNNGFLFINRESTYNQATLLGDMLNSNSINIKVKYYNPTERFIESNFDINVSENIYYTDPILVRHIEQGTIFIKNFNTASITASLEISGNGVDFITDNSCGSIGLNETKIIVPYYWAKYIRVKLTCDEYNINSNIILQGHLLYD